MTNIRASSIRLMQPLIQAGEEGSTPILALSRRRDARNCRKNRPRSPMQLRLERIGFAQAKALNELWHSRLPRFGTGFVRNQPYLCYAAHYLDVIYAVAIWSNPVARLLPQRDWLELRRLAVAPDAPRNTPSRMLAVMTRLIRHSRPDIVNLISYQDTNAHTGGIYRAAGWSPTNLSSRRQWNCPSRPRPPAQSSSPKRRWERRIA
jgi:hypothetical protein